MTHWKTILVPIDFSTDSLRALDYACALASKNAATILLSHVAGREASLSDVLGKLEALGREVPELHREVCAVAGQPVERLLEVAHDNQVDLIVVATHGRTGLESVLMGSTAAGLVRSATCPVLVLKTRERDFLTRTRTETQPAVSLPETMWLKGRPPTEEDLFFYKMDQDLIEASRRKLTRQETSALHLRRILVPTDFSAFSLAALPYAASLASAYGATLVILYVAASPLEWGPESISTINQDLQAMVDMVKDVPCTGAIGFGFVDDAIADVARSEKADLIVMATHGRKGLSRAIMGSTAEALVRNAPCSVLTLKPVCPGWCKARVDDRDEVTHD